MFIALLVKDFSVLSPVQFVIDGHPQIFVVFNDVHVMTQDGNWGHWCLLGSPQIHHQVFGLSCVELQGVLLTPCDKVVHHSPVFSLLTAPAARWGCVEQRLCSNQERVKLQGHIVSFFWNYDK